MVSQATSSAICGLPAQDRRQAWREESGRRVVRDDIEPLSGMPFHADATLRTLHERRTVALAADGDVAVALFVNLGRRTTVSSRGRAAMLGRGDAIFMSHQDHWVVASPGRFLGVILPRGALASRVDDLDEAIMQPIRRASVSLRVLTSYLSQLNDGDVVTPQLRQTMESHIHDLAAMVLRESEGVREDGMGAIAAMRITAARADIAASFDVPDLTVAAVAGRLGVSPRYLQRLFEASGTSFTAHVNELRLQRAFALLTRAPARRRRISDIALEAGFSDISHFNRLFRSRFGDTPRSVRSRTCKEP
jgi:AraC-like DNA-binding protein